MSKLNLSDNQVAVIQPAGHLQFVDHLAPLAVMMNVPLLYVREADTLDIAPFYPGLQIKEVSWEEFTPMDLFENYSLLIQSEFWPRDRLYSLYQPMETAFHKQIRNVYCPHGFSDKTSFFKYCAREDILLYYGQNMLDLLKEAECLELTNTLVRVGNYRYLYYKQNREYLDTITHQAIFSKFQHQQPIIFYAPTWKDELNNTSIMYSEFLLKTLPAHFNLIIKIHPYLSIDNPRAQGQIESMLQRYEDRGNVMVVKDWTLIYPLLAKTDVYIGDTSSIGYDFLTFRRPMFFLNQENKNSKTDRSLFLYQAGTEIQPPDYERIYARIEKYLGADQKPHEIIQHELYHYTFGDEISFVDLKKAILNSYDSPKKEFTQ